MLSSGQLAGGAHVAAVLEPGDSDNHPFVSRLSTLGVPVTIIEVGARSYRAEYRALSRLITGLTPQIVHTHGYRADVIGGLAARSLGTPAISTIHGFTGGGLKNLAYERIQRFAIKRADAVIAVSAPLASHLARAGIARDRIHCIPNGYKRSADVVDRSLARQRLGITGNRRTVGWVGRLSMEKGADVMLEALALTDDTWHLSMIGVGPEADPLRRLAKTLGIEERVTWHGVVEDAGTLLSAFDAFVISSRTEGTPITLLEAMDAGIPIVATTVGGVPDVVTAADAILVPPEEPASIARALADLRENPAAAAKRSTLATERVRAFFGHTAWVDAVNAVYGIVLGSETRRNRRG
jgi:glycosyltransferase involved in cell wall biosynthesis